MSGTFSANGTFAAGRVNAKDVVATNIAGTNVGCVDLLSSNTVVAPSIAGQEIAATIAIAAPQIATSIMVVDNFTLDVAAGKFRITNDVGTAQWKLAPPV